MLQPSATTKLWINVSMASRCVPTADNLERLATALNRACDWLDNTFACVVRISSAEALPLNLACSMRS